MEILVPRINYRKIQDNEEKVFKDYQPFVKNQKKLLLILNFMTKSFLILFKAKLTKK